MRTDLIDLSTAYLLGWKTLYDFAEWLAGIDWDDPGLDPESLKLAGRLELLATEVAEGLRPEAEFWQQVAEFVASETNFMYETQALLTGSMQINSSNDITDRPLELTPMPGEASQSWSISPLLEPA